MRAILHSDLNCYYAAVEMMLDPKLKGRPVAVCGSTETRHGIVLAKSYPAKYMGVKTGMANWQALQVCPDLIIVHPHYDQYIKYSGLVRDIYSRYTDLIEPFGMDECWLDVTGSGTLGTPLEIAEKIRKTVREELGLTVSIGVSFNKIFAKLGSDMKKPDAVTCITPEGFRQQIWDLPASDLIGVGPATKRKLAMHCVNTIGELAQVSEREIRSWLGVNGVRLMRCANGLDDSRVAPDGYVPPAKSVGHGITCTKDLLSEDHVRSVLLTLSPRVSEKLRKLRLLATGVVLAVRDSDLLYREYMARLKFPTRSWHDLTAAAMDMFRARYSWEKNIRSVTIRAVDLIPEKAGCMTDLFGEYKRREKTETIEQAVDGIRRRYGDTAVVSAAAMTARADRDRAREQLRMPSVMYR